jgi:hypothetical protein
MRIIIQVVAIVIFGYIAEILLPWYSIAFVALVFGYLINSGSNFLGGFLGVVTLWGIKLLKIQAVAASDLADRVSLILPVSETWILIVITLLIGGLVGGFAATTGGLLRQKKNKDLYYYPRR